MPPDGTNPLIDLHRQAQAEFQSYAGLEIVSTFGEPQAEYSAIRKSAGLMDQPQRGFVELRGGDRLSFLNNLLTNQTWDKQTKSGLSAGQVAYAFLLNAKSGRILTDMLVIEAPGDRTLLELDARRIPMVLAEFERYRFGEKVTFEDCSTKLHQIALHGPGAQQVLSHAQDSPGRILGNELTIWRDHPCGVPGFHLLFPRDAARSIWMHLITRFGVASPQDSIGKRPLRPIGWAAFNATRIEAGRAMFGIDFDETALPHETGPLAMSRAVSFTKGCYPGQEIVARMHARHQVAKQIVGIRMRDDALPIAGAQVLDASSNTVGAVTSSTISPVLSNAAICIATVKRPFFNLQTEVMIPAEGATRPGVVVDLPFLRTDP
jgi:folate-binding protein YgfZ